MVKCKIEDPLSLSVLVATCDRSDLIVRCLESIYSQEIKPQEVIVLDQSDDPRNTAQLCSQFGFSHIKLSEKNKSNAINLGMSLSCSNYVAVIDDDCIAQKDWIKTIIVSLTIHPDSIITGRVIAGGIEPNAVRSRLDDSLDKPKSYKKNIITPIFIFSGCNFILRKEIFQHVGLFDLRLGPGSKFLSSDDNEWSYRALSLGYRIFYDPSVIVQHRSWRSHNDDLTHQQASV